MPPPTEALRFAATGLLLLLGAVLLRDHRHDRSAVASLFLIFTVAGHLLLPLFLNRGIPLGVVHALLLPGLAVPFAFWLLAEIHFDDDFRWRWHHAALLAGLLAVGYVSWLTVVEHRLSPPLGGEAGRRFWALAPRFLGLAFVVHALIRIYVGARYDLVVPRLRVRYGVLVIAGTYIFLEIIGETLLSGTASEAFADRVHSTAALALAFGVCFVSMRVNAAILRPAQPSLELPALDPALAEQLHRLVEVDQVFRQEGLTIAVLARRLGAQEYKVRQLINAQLGFKNFNAFLHHFRIGEAQKVLGDSTKGHLGVAEVAYQVGYRSLATFNKAFREITGQTPTEFRASRQG